MVRFALALVNELGSGMYWIITRFWGWGVALFLYGLGVSAMFGDQYIVGSCFYFTAILIAATKVVIDAKEDGKKYGTFFFIVVGSVAAFGASLWWVKHTHEILAKTDSTPQITAWLVAHTNYIRSLPGRWILGSLIVGFILSSIVNVKRRQSIVGESGKIEANESDLDPLEESTHPLHSARLRVRIENLERQKEALESNQASENRVIAQHVADKQVLEEDVRLKDVEIEQYRNQVMDLVAVRSSLKETQTQLAEQEEILELARKEDQRHREHETALRGEIGNLRQVNEELENVKTGLVAEINNLREQLEPKVKMKLKPTVTGGGSPAQPSPSQIELDIEVENVSNIAIANFKVEVVEIRHGGRSTNPLASPMHMSPAVVLPQKEDAPSDIRAGTLAARGSALFKLAQKAKNEHSLKLLGTTEDVTIPPNQLGVDVVLVASGSNIHPSTTRVRVTGYRMQIGYANYGIVDD